MDRKNNRPLLLQKSGTQTDGRKASKGFGLRGEALLKKKKGEDRATISSKESARIRRVNIGILPYVKNTRLDRGCTYGDQCLFGHTEADGQPRKKSKKGCVRS